MKRNQIKSFPLSDTTVKNLEPESKVYKVRDSQSLYLQVSPNGKKCWLFRYIKADGKQSWLSLGNYPMIKPQQARIRVIELLTELANDIYPQTKQEKRERQRQENKATFETIANDWLEVKKDQYKGGSGGTVWKSVQSRLKRYVFPTFGKRRYKDIKPLEWLEFFEGLQRQTGYDTLIQDIIGYCRSIYRRAKFKGLCENNPLDGLTSEMKFKAETSQPTVSIDELPSVIKKIKQLNNPIQVIFYRLLILLFPRPSELRLAKWQDIDLDKRVWVKPAEIMKMGKAHAVPLPEQAIELLKELKKYQQSDYLFSSANDKNKPIPHPTLNTAFIRMGFKGKQTMHGFRHLASTTLNNLYSDKSQVIESALAHTKGGVKGVYDKSTHFEERKILMQDWAIFLDRLGV